MKPHIQVTEVMRASNLLYVYAPMYLTIHACRPVSVRVLRTAVLEWECCLFELGESSQFMETTYISLKSPLACGLSYSQYMCAFLS